MALRSLERSVKFLGITGLLPLTAKNSAEKLRFEISRKRVLISVFISLVSLFKLILQIIYYQDNQVNSNIADYMLYAYWSTMDGITSMFAHLLAVKNRKKICEFCNTLAKLLQQVGDLTGKPPKISLAKFMAVGGTAALSLMIFDFDQWALVNLAEYIVIILLMMVVLHLGVMHLIIASAVKELRDAFQANMECVFYPPDWWACESLDRIRSRSVVEMIQRYCSVYHDLFELTQEFAEVFATVSLVFISHLFMMIIIATFTGTRVISSGTQEEILNLLMLIGWSIYGFIAIVLLIYPCVTVMNQGASVVGTVNRFLAKCRNARVNEQLMKFAMLLTYEKIIFSPYNLFAFTYGLIPTITGSSISYMIILTQFDTINKNCTA